MSSLSSGVRGWQQIDEPRPINSQFQRRNQETNDLGSKVDVIIPSDTSTSSETAATNTMDTASTAETEASITLSTSNQAAAATTTTAEESNPPPQSTTPHSFQQYQVLCPGTDSSQELYGYTDLKGLRNDLSRYFELVNGVVEGGQTRRREG
eukprot:g5580.t1 g5580   contig2:848341-848796(-)